MTNTITITDSIIDRIMDAYDSLGGDYFGHDSARRYASHILSTGFYGSVDDLIRVVADDLWCDT
jgi:hypothetical protein